MPRSDGDCCVILNYVSRFEILGNGGLLMSKRRIMFIGIIIIAAIALNFGVMMSTKGNPVVDAKLHVELKADHAGDYQVFYGNLNEWTEEASQIVAYEDQKEIQDLCFDFFLRCQK